MTRHTVPTLTALLLAASLASPVAAGELAGVTLDDTAQVAGETLTLNGMGLRKKFFIKVYVAGLYLSEASADADAILAADGPRRTVMHFLYSVGADDMCEAWDEGLDNNTPGASSDLRTRFTTLCEAMSDVEKGQRMVFTYVPGTGTTVEVAGEDRGTIEGKDFADALFACWIGPKPPSGDFKAGLLGG